MHREDICELHTWINKLRKKSVFLPESRVCKNMLYPWSPVLGQWTHWKRKWNKTTEQKLEHVSLRETLHGMQIISESRPLSRTYFGLKWTYILGRHTLHFTRSNFFPLESCSWAFNHTRWKNNVGCFSKVLLSLLWNSLRVKYYSYTWGCATGPLHQLY